MACGCGLIFRGVGCKKIRQVSRPAVSRLIRAGAGKDKGYVRVKCVITIPGRPAGRGEGSTFHTLCERWWFIPCDLLRVKPLLGGFPVFSVTLAGSRPGGRPSFLLYDKKEGKETYPAAAPPSGVPSFRQCRAGSSQTRPAGSDMRSPFSARHHLQSARQRGPEMRVINGSWLYPVIVMWHQ